MDNKFKVAVGRKYDEGTLVLGHMIARQVSGSDVAIILNLYEQYGNADFAMMISKEA